MGVDCVVGCWSEHGLQCGCGVHTGMRDVALAFVQIFLLLFVGLCPCLCWAFVFSLFPSLFQLSLAFVWSLFSLLFKRCVAFVQSLCGFCCKVQLG